LFSFTAPSTTAIYPLSLHDALPIFLGLSDHDHVLLGSQDLSQPAPDYRMIVCNQDSNGCTPCRNTPSPGVVDTSLLQPERNGHRSEEHTSELQSRSDLVCRLLLEKK